MLMYCVYILIMLKKCFRPLVSFFFFFLVGSLDWQIYALCCWIHTVFSFSLACSSDFFNLTRSWLFIFIKVDEYKLYILHTCKYVYLNFPLHSAVFLHGNLYIAVNVFSSFSTSYLGIVCWCNVFCWNCLLLLLLF